MSARTTLAATGAAAVLLAGAAVAVASTSGDAPPALADTPAAATIAAPTADPTPSDALTPADDISAPDVRSLEAGSAGVVEYTVDGDELRVVAVDVAPGWTSEIEQARGREIEVDFTSGRTEIDADVEIEDGAPRERVRTDDDRRDDRVRDDDRRDDRVRDDDRSGRRDRDDRDRDDRVRDDDRSGRRGGDDRDDDDRDERSGRDHPEDD